jgi:hypothetical protein
MKLHLTILFICLTARADIVPTPGTESVVRAFENSSLVCNCDITSLRVANQERIRRGKATVLRMEVIASADIKESYNGSTNGRGKVSIEFEEELPATSGSMPSLNPGEHAVLFLKGTNSSAFEFSDRFVGATAFSSIPLSGVGPPGLPRLEAALTHILESGGRDDKVNALRLLQGLDKLGLSSHDSVASLAGSPDPEISLLAIAVLLKSRPAESAYLLEKYMESGTTPPDAVLTGVASELGRISDPAALPALESLASARAVSIRMGAMSAMRRIGSVDSAEVLVRRLDDADSNVRYLAVITLSEIFAKNREYAPSMYLFDRNPDFYTGLWKSWWSSEGILYEQHPQNDARE